MPLVPHPRFIVEYGNVYYLSMYEDKEAAKQIIDKLRDSGKNDEGKKYIGFFEAVAADVGRGIYKIKKRYDRRSKHFGHRRDQEMERASGIRGIRLQYAVDITERLGVGGTADLVARAAGAPDLWPEAIGSIAGLESHFILKHMGKGYTIDTIDDYASRVRRIDSRYYKDMLGLEAWSDGAKRKLYFRAQDKITRGFNETFNMEIEETPSADLYDGISKILEAESPSQILQALKGMKPSRRI